MNYTRGFLTIKDEETKKEIPFFVRVRNEDIELTKIMEIDEVLTKTSNQWTLSEVYKDLDATIYRFNHKLIGPNGTESFNNPSTDGNGEKVYNLETDCEINYKIYFDGRFEVYGRISLSWDKNISTYYLQLPYSIPNLNYQSISSMGSNSIGWHMVQEIMTISLSSTNFSDSSATFPFMLRFTWNANSGFSTLNAGKLPEPVSIRYEGRWK